jgi:SAM-dependent methyltransferase
MTANLQNSSDKVFWHGYLEFYERFFESRLFQSIAEIGVLRGHSIRWLLGRFPQATVFGADILPRQAEWPTDPRFVFSQFDQGDRDKLRDFLCQAQFDLIIEDGSHLPTHQVICLIEGVRALRPGGLYILEDIHTSHPAVYEKSSSYAASMQQGTALSVLLAIDHYKRLAEEIDDTRAGKIAHNSLLAASDVSELAAQLKNISLYRRTRLPDFCFNCGASDYQFSSYRCTCGVEIFSDSDSMSFVLEKK